MPVAITTFNTDHRTDRPPILSESRKPAALSSDNLTASAKSSGKTGVEMEALVATTIAAVTIYDMCKAIDRGMVIEQVCLQSKKGGKSGTYERTGSG